MPTRIEWRTHPVLADVNGDGLLDIAGNPRKSDAPQVWLGQAGGSWKPSSAGLVMPGATCGVGVDLGDVNNDGNIDLVVADHCNGLFVYLGDGEGRWRLGKSPMLAKRNKYESVRLGDLNKDGNLDLVAIASFRGGFTVRLGDGKGNWRKAATGLPKYGYGTNVELADVNQDGFLDVIAAMTPERGAGVLLEPRLDTVWLSTGPAKFEAASHNLPKKGKYWDVAVGDVNGDGYVDIAMSNDAYPDVPPLTVYLGNGGTSWTPMNEGLPVYDVASGDLYEGVALADVDGDGNTDLVAVNHLQAGISMWLGDGNGKWTACEKTGLPLKGEDSRGWGLAVKDVNRDGRADITAAFGRNGSGSVEVWVQE